ncbi:MAG: hypothetical protein JXB14_02805 [Candidatus Altiarchaeota archaeon]|nr:hypothetical protein [Candidatus Altiarchaeota archaeon]
MKDEIGCVNRVILILKRRKSLKLPELSQKLKIPEDELEILCKRLEKSGMLEVKYPWVGPIKVGRGQRFKEFLDTLDKLMFLIRTKRVISWGSARKEFDMNDLELMQFVQNLVDKQMIVVKKPVFRGHLIMRGKKFTDYLSSDEELNKLKESFRKKTEEETKTLSITRESLALVQEVEAKKEVPLSRALKILAVRDRALNWALEPFLSNDVLMMSDRFMKEPALKPGPRMSSWLRMAEIGTKIRKEQV